jgi:peptidoglycan/xylan/chitin deacetylase (PgdA/CDA1 family)
MTNLWQSNTPQQFWSLENPLPDELWYQAISQALPILGLQVSADDVPGLLQATLGEGQFGDEHWELGTAKRLYYLLKPMLPRALTQRIRRVYHKYIQKDSRLDWPVEDRYVRFLWETMRQVLCASGSEEVRIRQFWPDQRQFAFALTHDIETDAGQKYVRAIVEVEEQYGFRSSFNFVPERYPVDQALIGELRERGFEVGIHGLYHDGKLFKSKSTFMQRAQRINAHLDAYSASGFRAPLTHRHPEWMQALQVEYDMSFFDTDPYEPIPGGTMSIWPFMLGHFVELPYTLIQDSTLIRKRRITPQIWLDKVAFLKQYNGLALVNAHPDYVSCEEAMQMYTEFLDHMHQMRDQYWHELPQNIARWWRRRLQADDAVGFTTVRLVDDGLAVNGNNNHSTNQVKE